MQNSKVQDSMFIDMKYIILYRKLGFKEIKPDIFKKEYNNIAIIIESENQRFLYNKIWFDLKTYKDMVLIECLDRLLEKGYTHHEISISDEKIINIFKKNTLFCKVFVVDWGSDFTKALHEYQHSDVADVIIYTSRLTGGLIEFEYRIFSDMNMYNNGIFEYNKIKFNKDYCFIDNGEYINNNGFIMNKVRLSKYVGNNKKIQIPSGIKQIGAGAFWHNTVVEEIIIPQSVEIIEGDAFVYCENLKSINVPINVRLIGDNPFAGCPLLKIDFFTSHFVM
ncbi:MAG: leucine-rich repeat domain-containing protein [Bacillota bacterium]